MPHKVLRLVMVHLGSVNNNLVVAVWSLIAKWCLMVAQWDASGDSWVAFSVEAITVGEDEDLSWWLEQRLSSTLGARPTIGSPVGTTDAHAQGLPNVLAQFAAELGKGVAMGLTVWGPLANPTVLQGEVGDRESKQGYSTEHIAALMGFACVHRGQDLPTIWDYLKSPEGYTGGVSSPGRLGQGGTQGSFGVAHHDQYGGIAPGFSSGGYPGQQHLRAGWFDQCHPKFKAMMDTYLDLMQGHLQLADVLNASGKRQTDLSMLPKYTHPTGRPLLCWPCVLSRCRYHECHFLREGGHPDPTNITDNFANSAIEVLSKGIIARVNQLQGGGSPQINNHKWDAGTPTLQTPNPLGIGGGGYQECT
jgi:hypothetical protein